ncbi:Hypothetical predicted protein [Olea europaea subsp. europaea]|uniref:Uncharacterized protein n=1 Tax=Olea europaea subsp. europaea TaxID=158383 RepID=A0A8S0QIF8_OLEEU|nr:Hypothetical predicted protein [Olea europaea subsp. europaea]
MVYENGDYEADLELLDDSQTLIRFSCEKYSNGMFMYGVGNDVASVGWLSAISTTSTAAPAERVGEMTMERVEPSMEVPRVKNYRGVREAAVRKICSGDKGSIKKWVPSMARDI